MRTELRKKRKTLEAGLEKLLHTERLEFISLPFTRDYFIYHRSEKETCYKKKAK